MSHDYYDHNWIVDRLVDESSGSNRNVTSQGSEHEGPLGMTRYGISTCVPDIYDTKGSYIIPSIPAESRGYSLDGLSTCRTVSYKRQVPVCLYNNWYRHSPYTQFHTYKKDIGISESSFAKLIDILREK